MSALSLRFTAAAAARRYTMTSSYAVRAGSTITMKNGVLTVPNDPIIPFIEGAFRFDAYSRGVLVAASLISAAFWVARAVGTVICGDAGALRGGVDAYAADYVASAVGVTLCVAK